MALPAGWYPVAGDPTGTHRYWDGEAFTGGPERNRSHVRRTGFIPVAATSKWRLAGPIPRAIAALIDYCAPVVVLTGLAHATGFGIPGPNAHEWRAETNLLLGLSAWVLVNHVLLTAFAGRSLGKILTGLRVVDARSKSRPPGLARTVLREVLLLPGLLISAAMFLLGRRDGFHDLVAGTAVVYA